MNELHQHYYFFLIKNLNKICDPFQKKHSFAFFVPEDWDLFLTNVAKLDSLSTKLHNYIRLKWYFLFHKEDIASM